jgi:hypothetical protein
VGLLRRKGEVATHSGRCTADTSDEVRFRTTAMARLGNVGLNESIRVWAPMIVLLAATFELILRGWPRKNARDRS